MRMIDADKLKERIVVVYESLHNYKFVNLLYKWIDQQPTADKWISVKDKLPDEGKYVLVWESQGFAYCDKLVCGIWNIGANNGAIITHWMPLPEGPREESKK